jgi:hypothetical protein
VHLQAMVGEGLARTHSDGANGALVRHDLVHGGAVGSHIVAGGKFGAASVALVGPLAGVSAHVALEVAAATEAARTRHARKRVLQDAQVHHVDVVIEDVCVFKRLSAVSALVRPHAHVSAHVLGDRLLVVKSAVAEVALELLGVVDDAVARQRLDAAHMLAASLANESARRALAPNVLRQSLASAEALVAVRAAHAARRRLGALLLRSHTAGPPESNACNWIRPGVQHHRRRTPLTAKSGGWIFSKWIREPRKSHGKSTTATVFAFGCHKTRALQRV